MTVMNTLLSQWLSHWLCQWLSKWLSQWSSLWLLITLITLLAAPRMSWMISPVFALKSPAASFWQKNDLLKYSKCLKCLMNDVQYLKLSAASFWSISIHSAVFASLPCVYFPCKVSITICHLCGKSKTISKFWQGQTKAFNKYCEEFVLILS